MNTRLLKLSLIVSAVSLAGLGTLQAGAENHQPHMLNALHLLQDAKKSDHPASLLHSAKEELQHASHNKGGYRPIAIEIVDKAIAEAEVGDPQKMLDKINSAIATIHTGMSKAP